MTRETRKRIFSAIVLLLFIALVLKAGLLVFACLLLIAGGLIYDEIAYNFLDFPKRFSNRYLSGLLVFVLPFCLYWLVGQKEFVRQIILSSAVFFSVIGAGYLFFFTDKYFFKRISERFPLVVGFVLFISLATFAELSRYDNWLKVVVLLMIIVYSMDTGAWFFGKNFGKRKLFPSVSPKKTVEGLIGGVLCSTLVSSLLLFAFWRAFEWYFALILASLALLSQVGDLLESKFKRECEIKDSSSLIPGHGGVYDRVDALIFVAPVYFLFIRLLSFHEIVF